MPTMLELNVNGQDHRVVVEPTTTLLEVLRERLLITSPKAGCNTGDCGTCSVLLDGKLIRSCITAALVAQGVAGVKGDLFIGLHRVVEHEHGGIDEGQGSEQQP